MPAFIAAKPLPDYGLFGVRPFFAKIFLELTSLCNNRCVFCVSWQKPEGPRGTMSRRDMELVFAAAPDFEGSVILHLGGEAFMLPDLPERCAMIKKNWPKCRLHMTSTCNIDRGPEYMAAVFAAGLDSLTISCYAYSREDYAAVHGNDAFAAVRRNIAWIGALPDREQKSLTLQCMDNIADFASLRDQERGREEFIAFAREHGIRHVRHVAGDSRQGRLSGPEVAFIPPWPCDVVWGERAGELIIGWNLDILPCCAVVSHSMALGNLHRSSLKDIFASERYGKFYQQHWNGGLEDFPLCRSCTTRHRTSSEEETMRFAARQADALKGQDAYFWGFGEAYRRYGIFFSQLRPLAFLADHCGEKPAEIHGAPVLHPDEALRPDRKTPLVVFAHPPHNAAIAATIRKKYPWYVQNEVIFCPAASFGVE